MFNLLTIGDPVVDTHVQIDDSSAQCQLIPHETMKLCFDFGSKIPIRNSFQSLGGNAANVALAAAKLGLKTAILSTVGEDAGGRLACEELAKGGVNTNYLRIDENAHTRYAIVLNYCKERTILSYSEKKQYIWPTPSPTTDWIYYSGLSEGFDQLQSKLLEYLGKHPSVRLAFNPDSYLLKYERHQLADLLRRSDVLIVNLEEAELILNSSLKKEKTAASLVRNLLQLGAREVVITDAERGAWAGNKDELWHMKALPVAVVAKTGAGDSFSGAYVAARHLGHDISHALTWGIANGASVVQKEGPHAGLLDRSGLLKFLDNFRTIRPFEI